MSSYVEMPNGCWLWVGETNDQDYGIVRVTIAGKELRTGAHRYALMCATGIYETELLACHHCDIPRCVNPSHLYWGTPAQNTQDSIDRGRNKHALVKNRKLAGAALTNEQALAIFKSKNSYRVLAKLYGVSRQVVYNIKNGKSYRDVTNKK